MIKARSRGNWQRTETWLQRIQYNIARIKLEKYGEEGIIALAAATPKKTGKTASSWYYTIEHEKGRTRLSFHNSNINDHVPIAVILQYGHATKSGTWVEGIDYINPALVPIFNKLAKDVWKEVTK